MDENSTGISYVQLILFIAVVSLAINVLLLGYVGFSRRIEASRPGPRHKS